MKKTDNDIFSIPVHPAADVFPMLDDEELAELANDIAEHGLRQPLVVSGVNGSLQLIDGRNRRAACALVKVTPTTVELEGDPISYILSANINRRHLTKGQRAMAVAVISPEPAKGGRGKKNSSVSEEYSGTRVSMARTVLHYAPALTDSVLSGAMGLDQAYEKARTEKFAADSYDERLRRLKESSPELATDVIEGRLTLEGATAEMEQRKVRLRAHQIAIAHNLVSFQLFASNTATEKDIDEVAKVLFGVPKIFEEAAGMSTAEYISALEVIRDRANFIIRRRS